MQYRLALDVGTASIGLAAYELNEEGEPVDIRYHTVRIFEEPLQPARKQAVGLPKKAARRLARQQRRQIERKAGRLRGIAEALRKLGLNPATVGPDSGQNIHRLRAQAAAERIELADFARVLLKLAKRRGYRGGFRARKEGEDAGVVEGGISRLKAELRPGETLGQYLARRHDAKQTLKLKEAGLYADRELVTEEFRRLWATQAEHHPVLRDPAVEKAFRDAILFQRPLKSPAPMVGLCRLEPAHPRAPMADPAAQAFRIEKQLADLRWGMGREPETLTPEQKSVIRGLLRNQDTVKFESIYKALDKAGCPKPPGRALNLHRASRDELRGDRTRAVLRSKKFQLLEDWDRLSPATQSELIGLLADLGSPEQLDDPEWHRRFFRQVPDGKEADGRRRFRLEQQHFGGELIGFVEKLLNTRQFDRLGKMGFDSGRSGYSAAALEKLTALMRQEGLDESEAIARAYPETTAEKTLHASLPPPPETGNTVVDVALRQLGREIRNCMAALGGPPAEALVELSRDMALGVERRNEIESRIDRNRRRRLKAAEELQRHGAAATRANVDKYLLWEEQEKKHCPYCNRDIALADVVNGQATQFEHILPRSLTRVGGKREQLVLAHGECNAAKDNNTPWDAFGGNPPRDPERWGAVLAQAQRFAAKKELKGKARLLTLEDWEKEVLGEDVIQGFSDRQFQETSWIAKLTAGWLRQICPSVQVSRGEMTAYLRRIWHLDTVIAEARLEAGLPVFDTEGGRLTRDDFDRHRRCWENHPDLSREERTDRRIDKRKDHRHHLIDALVIGLSSPRLYQKMAREYKQRAEGLPHGQRPKLTLSVKPPLKDLRKKALELVKHCTLSHKPDRWPGGPLFKATAYGVAEISEEGTVRLRLKPSELAEKPPAGGPRRVLVLRQRLAELADDKTSVEKARAWLGDIASAEVRRIVLEAFDRRVAGGKSARQALLEPIVHPQYGTPIKAVKMMVGNRPGVYLDATEAHPVIHESRQGRHYKLLQHEGYAYLEVQADGKGVKTRLVRPVEAVREERTTLPEGTKRFFKGDCVRDRRQKINGILLIKQIWSQGNGCLLMVPYTDAREIAEVKKEEGPRIVSGKRLLDLKVV